MSDIHYVLLHPADMEVARPHYHVGRAMRNELTRCWELVTRQTVGCKWLAAEDAEIRDQDVFKFSDMVVRFKLAELHNGDFDICAGCTAYFYADPDQEFPDEPPVQQADL